MIGTTIGSYRLTSELGSGTYGIVYRAQHAHVPDVQVAVKVMRPALAGDSTFVRSLQRECAVLHRMRHPNIVGFRDLVIGPGHPPALVLELLEGEDLAVLSARGPVPVDEAVAAARGLLAGLAYAHGQGVVHRDIKPANVFRVESGEIRILDFGVARAADGSRATQTGEVKGTLDYMAPELFDGVAATPTVDVYAAGLVLWELLVGGPACPEGSLMKKLGWHGGVGAPDVRQRRPAIPGPLAEVVAAMTAREGRPADAAAALALLDGVEVSARRPPEAALRSRPGTVTVDTSGVRPSVKGPADRPPTVRVADPSSLDAVDTEEQVRPRAEASRPVSSPAGPTPTVATGPGLSEWEPPGPPFWAVAGVLVVGGAAAVAFSYGLLICFGALPGPSPHSGPAERELLTEPIATAAPAPLAEPTEDDEALATELLQAANEAMGRFNVDEARSKLDELTTKFGATRAAQAASRLEGELSVIGKRAGALDVEKWHQGWVGDLHDGQATLLVFFEVWCPHSKREVPKLEETFAKFRTKGNGLGVIGITKQTRDMSDDDVQDFIREKEISFPIAKEDGAMSSHFNVHGVPAAALVKGGEVVWRGHPARLTDDMIEKWL